VKLLIGPAWSRLSGDKDILEHIHEHFSFRNKAVEGQLRRLKKTLYFKERQFMGDAPDWFDGWKAKSLKELQDKLDVYCCRWDGKDLLIPTGLMTSLVELMGKAEISLQVEDKRDWDGLSKRSLTGQKPDYLRIPQKESLEILTRDNVPAHEKGIGLLRMATGTGKSGAAVELIRHHGVKSIFLAPSNSILKQMTKRLEVAFGKKNVRTYGGGKKEVGYVTCASYQSVFRADPSEFDDVQMVVADECHHVGADTFFETTINKIRNAVMRYGLSAYEERADGGTMLVEAAVGPVIYSYDAARGIADGYLAKPTFMIYSVGSTEGQWTRYKEKDGKRTAVDTVRSIPYDRDEALQAYRHWVLGNDLLNQSVSEMVSAFVQDNKSVLILVDELEHGEKLKALLPDAGFVFGGSKDNENLLAEFNKRKLKVIVGTSCVGEGTDTIPVDVLINLMGGASISQTKQAAGRALRNEEDENGIAQKPNCLIIDFDFPHCKMLSRHSSIRQKVYEELGEIHQGSLIT
jgi:superfamily II DNA or RNA helicase